MPNTAPLYDSVPLFSTPPGGLQLGERFRCTQTVPLPNWPGHLDSLTIWRRVEATVDCRAPDDPSEASYCRLTALQPSPGPASDDGHHHDDGNNMNPGPAPVPKKCRTEGFSARGPSN